MAIKYLDDAGATELVAKTKALIATKQDALVSGTNLKTINNTSLLGSGNIDIGGSAPDDIVLHDGQGASTTEQTLLDNYYTKTQTESLVNTESSARASADTNLQNQLDARIITYLASTGYGTTVSSGYFDIPMANCILRVQYGHANPYSTNKTITFPQSFDTLLFANATLSGTGDTQSQRATITSASNTGIVLKNLNANGEYIRWFAIGIKNY